MNYTQEAGKIALIRKRILLIALLGVLITGLISSLSAIIPSYFFARDNLEQITLSNTERQANVLNNLLDKYQDQAAQFTSRTEIRLRLEKYADGKISLEALTAFSEPRLKDAMRLSTELLGLVRFGTDKKVVVNIGETPRVLKTKNKAVKSIKKPIYSLITLNSKPVIRVQANIYSTENEIIGQDVLYFSHLKMLEVLNDKLELGKEASVYLVNSSSKQVLEYDEITTSLIFNNISDSKEYEYLNKAVNCQKLPIKTTHKCNNIFFFAPLEGSNWLLVTEIPSDNFYLPIQAKFLWPMIAIFSMVLVAVFTTSRALRPLTRRLAFQAKELKHSTEELRLVASVFEGTREAIAVTDANMHLIKVNSAFSQITGFELDEVLDKNLESLFYKKKTSTIEQLQQKIKQSLEFNDSWQGEIWYKNKYGELLPVLQSISAVLGEDGQVVNYIHIFNDISESKANEEHINYLAHYDQLTGLPNRTLINRRIKSYVNRAKLNNQGLAILFMDLDHFKEVNDTLGHPVGDLLLQAVGQRLKAKLREQDILGRLGGDEFLAVLDHAANTEASGVVAQKIIHSLIQPFELEGNKIQIGVSIGIAIYPKDGNTADELIKNADIAMYRAKDGGRNTFRYFSNAEFS